MKHRELVASILSDFGGLPENDADHLAGMIIVALQLDCTSDDD
jgi:hypothetical protein